MKKSLLCAACVALFASSFVAKADTKITNLTEPVGFTINVTSTAWLAQKFKTDASSATFTLDSVTLKLHNANNPVGNFFVKIYDTTGSEGAWLPNNSSVLGTLTGSSDPSTANTYTYTASGITLQANTNYWIVAGVSSGAGDYSWWDSDTTTTTGAWSITATNTDAWSMNGGVNWTNADGSPYMFSVNATASVPEPSAVLLLMAGGGVLAFVRRRQERKA